ncbi:MAG: AMP phosphorylase [Thermoplasmata archaeon]|nr:MAG: AMP phosphorylase [Thermoplasmata archaeon]
MREEQNNKYAVRKIDLEAGKYTVIMHDNDAQALGVREQDRVRVVFGEEYVIAVVETTQSMVKMGEVGLSAELHEVLKDVGEVRIYPTSRPESVEYIRMKMDGKKLTEYQIRKIVEDIVGRNLTDIELSAYVSAVYMRGMDQDETYHLVKAMIETGETIDFGDEIIYDFHSIGGVPGNKVTLIVVPIIASMGLTIPKTCSRAISSACGTADIFEVLAPVSLSAEEIKRIALEVGGTIAWGGAVSIAPADDIIIRAEYPLGIDPPSQLLASIMAKKKGVGANNLLIDIPMGPETKVESIEKARWYARNLIELGEKLDMKVSCAITYGGQPIGRAVGPALEVWEALQMLEGKQVPRSLYSKAIELSSMLLEMGGVLDGKRVAEEAIKSGKALEKLREIVEAQGGSPEFSSESIEFGKYSAEVVAKSDGYVKRIRNRSIIRIAREAGSPYDKKAGVLLAKKEGYRVEKGETLLTIYSSNKTKLENALRVANKISPVSIEGMILEKMPSYREIV